MKSVDGRAEWTDARTMPELPCADPGIFVRGGPCQSDQKSFFLVLSLFYRSQMVNFKEIYHFSRFHRGSNIFQGGGGVQLLPGGSNCLFPIETHITSDFPGGSGPPVPPLDPHLTTSLPLRRGIRGSVKTADPVKRYQPTLSYF